MPPVVHRTVVDMLRAAAAEAPSREALVDGARRLTYRDYLACVAGFAHELAALGARGERVAYVLPNGIDICVATFAIHAAGAQAVPLNPLYTERELAQILEDAAPRILIHGAETAALAQALAAKLAIAHCIAVGPGARALDAWRGGDTALPEPGPRPDGLGLLQYTGGTTGRSKGVNIRHGATARNIAQREGLLPTGRGGERIVCVMPLFHSYALAMGLHLAAYCCGALVILPRYKPDTLLATMVDEKITIFPGSPTIFTGLLSRPDFTGAEFARVHTCYSGSAALPAEILQRWEKLTGCPIYEGYGQTEAGPVLTYNPVHGRRKPGSVGIVLADTEVQVVDAKTGTRVLPPGEIGEIRARGPQIMSGYRNLPAETAAALRDGWLYTGDLGEFDDEGYLYIRDRKKDMVIVGGYNVYPREVEEVLHMHPAVAEAAAVGVADSYRGEVVHAYVIRRPGAALDDEVLRAHCAANLAKYKIPAVFRLVDTLPRTTVGKLDKKTLRVIASEAAALRDKTA